MSMSPEERQAMGLGIRGKTARSSVSLLFLGLVFRTSIGSVKR